MRLAFFGDIATSLLEKLSQFGGLASWLLFFIIFAESGLFFGFFLPGDSLLFTAGFLSSDPRFNLYPWWALSIGCAIAAVAGDQVGYSTGHRIGPALYKRDDSRFFKQRHLAAATEFFEHHGNKAIVMARFVPVVRTFCPIVAGASSMDRRQFTTYNVMGGIVWGAGFPALGFALGARFPFLREKIEYIAIVIVIVSLTPVLLEVLRHRRKKAREAELMGAEDLA